MKNKYNGLGVWLVIGIIFAILLAFPAEDMENQKDENLTYGKLMNIIDRDSETISSIILEVNEKNDFGNVVVSFKDGIEKEFTVSDTKSFENKVLEKIETDKLSENTFSVETMENYDWVVNLIPTIITIALFVFIISFFLKSKGSGGGKVLNFGKSKARLIKKEDNKITFEDVAGLVEEKEEVEEIVEFLKSPDKFRKLGARIPAGFLLVGAPGTGKTLLAKAVAGEAEVPFFSISGSDFVEMFVGVGASRVRDLFEQAKKSAPSVIFVDEIDAVGRKRGAGVGGGHDEREQTLNQMLVEMDGFEENTDVIVLAATNRVDILDPALLRPGRFDRRVVISKPDSKGRRDILKIHAKDKPMAKNVEIGDIARMTAGFTGADLENLLNEASILAARKNKKEIESDDLKEAFIKVGVGTEKKSKVISDKEKKITAYHEAGHAIIHEILDEMDKVHSISVIPTGMAGGYTMPVPKGDTMYKTKTKMEQEIVSLLGGRVAESIIFNEITTGASNDIKRATQIARSMVTKFGMSDKLGPIKFGSEDEEVFLGKDYGHTKNYGEAIAKEIDDEIKYIITKAYEKCEEILNENIEVLHEMAAKLIEKEKITGKEVESIFIDITGKAPKPRTAEDDFFDHEDDEIDIEKDDETNKETNEEVNKEKDDNTKTS